MLPSFVVFVSVRHRRPASIPVLRGFDVSGCLREGAWELAARGDTQLAVRVAEMNLDRLRRHVEHLCDVAVRLPIGGEICHPVVRSPSMRALPGGRPSADGLPSRRSPSERRQRGVAHRTHPPARVPAAAAHGRRSACVRAGVPLRAPQTPSHARAVQAPLRVAHRPLRAARSRPREGSSRARAASVQQSPGIPSPLRSRARRARVRAHRPGRRRN
jgi:hypothetical protein